MSMPKKGSRKIVVDDVAYRWRVSWKKLGDWRAAEPGEIDEERLGEIPWFFGDGDLLEGECSIIVERQAGPSSLLRCACPANKVDALFEHWQRTEITPSLVREIIRRALAEGWDPASSGDVSLTLPSVS